MYINIVKNYINSICGLKIAFKDKSFSAEIYVGLFLIPCFYFFSGPIYFLFFLTTYFLLLSVELINTALEKLCDRITGQYDEKIKAVKDLSSAAVMVIVFLLIVQVLIVFSL